MLNTTEMFIIIIIMGGSLEFCWTSWLEEKYVLDQDTCGDRQQGLPQALDHLILSFPGVKHTQENMSAAPASWGVDYGWALFSSLHFSALL